MCYAQCCWGVTPGPVLREHSWKCSGIEPGLLHTRQNALLTILSLWSSDLFLMAGVASSLIQLCSGIQRSLLTVPGDHMNTSAFTPELFFWGGIQGLARGRHLLWGLVWCMILSSRLHRALTASSCSENLESQIKPFSITVLDFWLLYLI